MKKRLVSHVVLGLSLAALPFLGGCSQQKAGNPTLFLSNANAEPATTENELALATGTTTNLPAAAPEVVTSAPMETNAPALAEAAMSEPAPVTELKPPPNVRLSPVLAEVVKLVQSGVEEPVLLSYITNTTGYFTLGAEEIVYLNDLGVAGNVMTVMMQHDQSLRELRINAVQAAQPAAAVLTMSEPEEPEVAAAPAYIEPPAVAAEPAYVSNEYFDDTLAPYGSWVYVSGYGRCWRPTVVIGDPGWRPYCNRGRWVYSDCGWYWLSDYSWGATTFHYGRWFNHNRWGWCWWPDNVWAPSWVSWRYSNEYCGWAPLPPTAGYHTSIGLTYQNGEVGSGFGFGLGFSAYAFVSWGSFCSPRPYQHCLPPNQANQVYHNTTPVNHFEPGGHGRVNNRGISVDQVRQRARTDVRTVSLREQTAPGQRGERLDRDGRTLAVHRPNLIPVGPASGRNLESAGRNNSPRGNEALVSQTPVKPVASPQPAVGHTEVRPERNLGRTADRFASPMVPPSAPVVQAKPAVTTPSRVEPPPSNQRAPQVEAATANRTRATSPVVLRTPQPPMPVVTPAAPTPKVSQPRVIQITPQTTPRPSVPAPSSSVVVIGGRNNTTRSAGRDYSVYSTPAPVVRAPQVPENQPIDIQPSRSAYGRSENRSSYSTYSTPQAGQVIPPTARPAATPSYTPRPTPSSPAPSFTPRPTPSITPSAPRVETRTAPSAPVAVPATSRPAPSQGQSRR